jgi:hypothetical protein
VRVSGAGGSSRRRERENTPSGTMFTTFQGGPFVEVFSPQVRAMEDKKTLGTVVGTKKKLAPRFEGWRARVVRVRARGLGCRECV